METNKEISVVEKKASSAVAKAREIAIENDQQLAEANEFLGNVKKLGKIITAEKEKITKPLNEGLKNARALFKPMEDAADEAEGIVKKKVLAYLQKVEAERQAEADRIEKQREAGRIKDSTADTKLANLGEQKTVVNSQSASSHIRMERKVAIDDPSVVPDEYWVIDEQRVKKAALAGVAIPGVRVYEEAGLSSRTY